jgi:hypothetical protein
LLNTVDANSRSDLRELLELNFAQFGARMEQRFAQQDAKWEQRFAGFETRILRWMFTLWTGTTITLAGLLFVALRAR